MKTLRTVLVTLLVAVLLAAGFVWSGLYNIGADDEHTGVVYTLLETLRDRSIAARARAIKVVNLEDASLISSGAGNYDAMCVGCHLSPELHESELSKGLNPTPPNLAKTQITDPAAAFWVIKHGIKASGMPAWGKTMEDRYIWGLVAFLQKLPTLSAAEYRAQVTASPGHAHGGGETIENGQALEREHGRGTQGDQGQKPVSEKHKHSHDDNHRHSH